MRPTKAFPTPKKKKKTNKGILLMVLNNGVVRGSHGHGRARLTRGSQGWRTKDPWMMH